MVARWPLPGVRTDDMKGDTILTHVLDLTTGASEARPVRSQGELCSWPDVESEGSGSYSLPAAAPALLVPMAAPGFTTLRWKHSPPFRWRAPHRLILLLNEPRAHVALQPEGLVRKSTEIGEPDTFFERRPLGAAWLKAWKARPARRYHLRERLATQPMSGSCFYTFDGDGSIQREAWLSRALKASEIPLPATLRPPRDLEAQDSVFVFPSGKLDAYESYSPGFTDCGRVLFGDLDEARTMARRIMETHAKGREQLGETLDSAGEELLVECLEVPFGIEALPLGQVSEDVFYVLWNGFVWRIDLATNHVVLALPALVREWRISPDGSRVAIVVPDVYLASQIRVIDIVGERCYQAASGW